MRHPIEKYNQQQAETLASLPEENREWMARMFRIGNATYCYYNRAKELAAYSNEILQVYFEEYLSGIEHEGLRRAEEREGLQKAKSSFGFRRYILERHDIGMDEFLRLHLSEEDYAFHRSNAPDAK
ncbi:hypothetical protein GCM10027592_56490 [Spirosoma flavus]